MPSNMASEGKSGHSSRRPSSESSVPAAGEIPFHCLLPNVNSRGHGVRSDPKIVVTDRVALRFQLRP
jgi:hypothetical protein